MKKPVRKALLFVNTFGALGYLAMVLAWVLCAAAIVLLLMQSSVISVPSDTTAQSNIQTPEGDVILARIIAAVITFIMAVLTLGIFLLLPYLSGKWGAGIMRWFMKLFHVVMTRRNLFLAKGLTLTIPLLGFIGIQLFHEPLDMTIPAVHVAAILLCLLSLGCFIVQHTSARSLNVNVKDLW
ncbi:MAG TPA: hypothetical protein VFT59_03360 [Candidatus Saccharimonadales bacterium]|nr:hypothetical protein [Candidatus Saccharimonadales bacterium]